MNVSPGGNPLEQIAMTSVQRSNNQQEVNGQNALKLIQSAQPQALESPRPVSAPDGAKGSNIDTFA